MTPENQFDKSEKNNKRLVPWWGWLLGIISLNFFINILIQYKQRCSENKSKFQPATELMTDTQLVQSDDLKLIKGIGPKISELLQSSGIRTFAQLAEHTPEEILEILSAGGVRLADTSSWPKQARKLL